MSQKVALAEETRRVSGKRGANSGPPRFTTALVCYDHAWHASFGKRERRSGFQLLVLAFRAKAEFGIKESSQEETEKARKI